ASGQPGPGGVQIGVLGATLSWIIMTECLSIIENLGRAGVPLPAGLKKWIEAGRVREEEGK
ncbi:MAG: hypothetical protein C4321_10560, partial [Chloroflexota bacterium]